MTGLRAEPVPDGSPGPERRSVQQQERQDAIAELVLGEGSMRIDALSEMFGVSSMTIHRDLDALAARGLLRKSRAVATAVASSLFEAGTEYRSRHARTAKESIARAVFELVEPGQAVILDDSTTGLHLAPLLVQRLPLTVITNFQRLLEPLSGVPSLTLINPGGEYYQWCEAYMGSITIRSIESLRADVFISSCAAVTDDICFQHQQETVLVKRAMFAAAARRILYVDHTKFQRRALHALAPVADFDTVVLDAGAPPEVVSRLRQRGVDVIVAP